MKKLWTWLEGKKMIIGMGIILLNSIVQWQFPNAMPADVYNSIRLTGEFIGGFGLFDKARRTENGQKFQNLILNSIKKK